MFMFLKGSEYEHLDKETKKSMEYSIADGIAWQMFFTLTSGVFIVGFALFLGATPFQIGLVSALPSFASIAQVIGAYFVEKTGKGKAVTVYMAFASRIIWIFIILTPFFILPPYKSLWIVIFLFGLSHVFASISGVAWLSWISNIVPSNVTGKFFGRRSAYMGFLGVVIGIMGALFLDYWELNHTSPLYAFSIVFSIAVILGAIGILFLRMTQDVPTAKGEDVTLGRFKRMILTPFKDPNFRKFVKFGFFWGASVGLAGPFLIVYQLETLDLSYMIVVSLTTLFVASGIISLHKWGGIIDNYGAKHVLAISAFVAALYPLFFLFITEKNFLFLIPVNILVGIAWSGVDLASAQILLKTAPQINKSVYFSSFAATSGIALAVSPIIGGIFADIFSGISYPFWIFTFSGLHLLFLISGVLRLWSTILIKDINDSAGGNLNGVIYELKNTALMNIFINFYYFSYFSIGIFTLPFTYGRKFFDGSGGIFKREVSRLRMHSMKTLLEIEKIIKLSVNELGRINYKDATRILTRLNILDRRVKTLENKVATVKDEKLVETVKADIPKVEAEANTVMENLEAAKEPVKVPKNYVKRILTLLNRTSKKVLSGQFL